MQGYIKVSVVVVDQNLKEMLHVEVADTGEHNPRHLSMHSLSVNPRHLSAH